MMNQIQPIGNICEGLRFVKDKTAERLWFVARDVCDRLGTDPKDIPAILSWGDEYCPLGRLRGMVDIEGINELSGLRKDTRMLSEPGFYRLVFASRKPEAVAFQKWICGEVLPAIRKHGCYFTQPCLDKILNDPDMLDQFIAQLKADQEKRRESQTSLTESHALTIDASFQVSERPTLGSSV